MENGHATEQELRNYALFHLSVSECSRVGQHLRECPACNGRYRDGYAGLPGAPPPAAHEPDEKLANASEPR